MYDVHADPENAVKFVRAIARNIKRGLPAEVQIDDLIQDGNLGMLLAARRYDASQHTKFKTFAGSRIHGAMLDGIRDLDWVSRKDRKKQKNGGPTPPKFERLLTGGGRTGEYEGLTESIKIDGDQSKIDDEDEFEAMVAMLPVARLRRIVRMYFVGNCSLDEIGQRLGIGLSRTSQLMRQALDILWHRVPLPIDNHRNGTKRGLCHVRRNLVGRTCAA